MTFTNLVLEYGEFYKVARIENPEVSEADVFRNFVCENNLTLRELSILVNERPQLGKLNFFEVSEARPLEVVEIVNETGSEPAKRRGRPEKYGEFYETLGVVLSKIKEVDSKYSFNEVYELAGLMAMRKNQDVKIPAFSTAYVWARKVK